MNTPDKIYLTDELGERTWSEDRITSDDVEYIKTSLTTDQTPRAEVTLDCGVSCPAVDSEMLTRAMKKAVEVGLIPKLADEETYLKNWNGMMEVLHAAVGN